MRPTLEEIARIAKVSVATVSLVLNEKGNISDETRARVKRVIAEVGYKRQPSKRMIGIVGQPPDDLVSSLHQAAAEYGYDLKRVSEDELSQSKGQRSLSSIAGLIVYGGQWEPATLERFGAMYPTVLLGGHTRRTNVDSIWVDNAHGIDLAVGYLVDRGHRSIVLLNGPPDTPTSWEKKSGFEWAIATSQLPIEGSVIAAESFLPEAARSSAEAMLTSMPGATAVIIGELSLTPHVYRVLHERNIAVPRDISLIVFRDNPSLLSFEPPMTAIGFDPLEIARETLTHLVQRIQAPETKGRRVLYKPFIIERGSVARLR